MTFTLGQIFRHKVFTLGVALIFVQQAIVALSVYFIARTIQVVDTPGAAWPWALAFLVSIMLPYLPGHLANLCMDLWTVETTRSYQAFAADHHPYGPGDYSDTKLEEKVSTLYATTTPKVLTEICHYSSETTATVLHTLMNIGIISYIIDYRILLCYIASLILCLLFNYRYSSFAGRLSETSEIGYVRYTGTAQNVWPNLSLGNRLARQIWAGRLEAHFSVFRRDFLRERRFKTISAILISLFSVLPTGLFLGHLFYTHMDDPKYLAVLVVGLPRTFQILVVLSELSNLLFDANHMRGKFKVLQAFFDHSARTTVRVAFRGLADSVSDRTWSSDEDLESLINTIASRSSGRITIKGPNGSGKTTLLLHLKDRFGGKALYLPAKLIFDLEQQGSTGEQKREEIKLALSADDIQLLLLDEWDANLDQQNLDRINALIDDAALNRVVVEVRHRT